MTFTLTFEVDVDVDFYLCANPDVTATESSCPKAETIYLASQTFKGLKKDVTRYFTKLEIAQDIVKVIARLAWDILVQDFVDCYHGSVSGCGWAAANFIPGKKIEDAVQAIRGLDRVLRSGDDITGAWEGLRAVGLSDEAVAGVGTRALKILGESCRATRVTRAASRCWVEKGGPGVWAITNEKGKSSRVIAYEFQVTRIPDGFGYKILNTPNPKGELKFDGYKNGTLLEAKGPGYAKIMEFRPNLVKEDFVPQAEKQVAAAPGRAIEWHIAEEKVFLEAKELFSKNDKLSQVRVIYTPPAS